MRDALLRDRWRGTAGTGYLAMRMDGDTAAILQGTGRDIAFMVGCRRLENDARCSACDGLRRACGRSTQVHLTFPIKEGRPWTVETLDEQTKD